MNKDKKPKVSIGVPVYNGEKYIKNALDSLVHQTYCNIEIIISDNASKDNTQQICESFVKKHDNVIYIKNEENLGAVTNFNNCFALSTGKYFKWAHSDDMHDPKYIEKCVQILENDEDVVLCHSLDNKIDNKGNIIGEYKYREINQTSPLKRFKNIISMKPQTWLYNHGLIRSAVLKKTRLYGSYHSSDRVMLTELALLGKFHQIQEHLFYRRSHEEAYTENVHALDTVSWWTLARHGRISFPYVRIFKEYIRAVNYIIKEKVMRIRFYFIILIWFISEGILLTFRYIGTRIFSNTPIGKKLRPIVTKLFKFLGYG